MFLMPRLAGPDAYGSWTCVLFEDDHAAGIGTGPTERDAVEDAKEHAKGRFGVGDESIVLRPTCRLNCDLKNDEIVEAEVVLEY